jgi:NADPH:quinone reductase-like Zn-dependent oxidoreductase
MWRSGFLVSAVLVPFCSLVGHEVWLLTANLRYRTSRPDAVATMMAVTYSAHGAARAVLQVGSVAQPQQPPAQGMLVIRVVAAALNPVDFKQLRNDQPDALVPKPRTLGFDVSGVVVAAGEGSGFDIGDAVYGMLPLVGSPWGALSEFTVAEATCFAKAPRTIPLEQAAALPLVSLTVMQVFEQAGLLPGEDRKEKTILIQAAAGGVGSFAVQYARNVLGFGHVLGTCSAPNESLVRELGATATIDYTKTSFEKVAREARPTPALHASAHHGVRPSCTGGS